MKGKKVITDLFLSFFKIGLFTFGGGYAMIPLLENEFVYKKKTMQKEEFLDLIAISESTPGPIAINSATYIGYKHYKFIGSLVSTVAVCIPSFVIIYLISLFLDDLLTYEIVSNAFKGIQSCVVYLILSAGFRMLKGIKKSLLNIFILSVVILCMITFSLFAIEFSSIFYILISGALGLFIYSLKSFKTRKEQNK